MSNLYKNRVSLKYGLLGAITATYFSFGLEIFLFLLSIFFMGFFVSFMGNIFSAPLEYNFKKIIGWLVILLVFSTLQYYLNNESLANFIITISFTITNILYIGYIVVGYFGKMSIEMYIKQLPSLYKDSKEYLFRFKIGVFIGLFAEIAALGYLIFIVPNNYIKIISVIFWILSALLFVLMRGTSFILNESKEKITDFLKIFAASRITFYLLPIYVLTQGEFPIFWFLFIITILYLTMIEALYPYIVGSDYISKSIDILQYLNEEKKPVKISKIMQLIEEDKETTQIILSNLKLRFYVDNSGDKFFIHPFFKYMT
ncbi:MAG: hypothetical protein PF569_00640 [Candidatus Woesearchaeota archaeon]|jgi:hypothetical protein|nr:hypothetical protein [Candidatus Woesearchaeota archaeon]